MLIMRAAYTAICAPDARALKTGVRQCLQLSPERTIRAPTDSGAGVDDVIRGRGYWR